MALGLPTLTDIPGYLNELYKYLVIFGKGTTPLTDPGADRIPFWDDSAGKVDWLTAGSGLTISGTTVTASAGMTLIDTKTASNSATLDFTTGLDSTYDKYVFDLSALTASVDDREFWIQVSKDAGANWIGGGTEYQFSAHGISGGTGYNGSNGGTSAIKCNGGINVGDGVGNGTGESLSGQVWLTQPSNTTLFKLFKWQLEYLAGGSADPTVIHGCGYNDDDQAAINGVRFLFETGNIASGVIRLYGVSK